MANKDYEINVDKSVSRIETKDRIPFELIIGEKYYISYGSNVAEACILESIKDLPNSSIKAISVKFHHRKFPSVNSVYSNEIGRSPKEAVQNES